MLNPNKIKVAGFSKSVRGYTITEVDEHIEYLVRAYTSAFNQIAALDAKLEIANLALVDYEKNKDYINQARERADAQIEGAKAEADAITSATKNACAKILLETKMLVKAEREKLSHLSSLTDLFKERLVDFYREQVLYVREHIPSLDRSEYEVEDDHFMQDVLEQIAIDQKSSLIKIPLLKKVGASEPAASQMVKPSVPNADDKATTLDPINVPPRSKGNTDNSKTQVFSSPPTTKKSNPSAEPQFAGASKEATGIYKLSGEALFPNETNNDKNFTDTFDFREAFDTGDNTVEFTRPKKK